DDAVMRDDLANHSFSPRWAEILRAVMGQVNQLESGVPTANRFRDSELYCRSGGWIRHRRQRRSASFAKSARPDRACQGSRSRKNRPTLSAPGGNIFWGA